MILSGKEIKKRLGKDIFIEPFNENQLNPNSYNLRLHNELLVYKNHVLDMKQRENKAESLIIPEEGLILEPGRLYLGRTVEYTRTEGWCQCWKEILHWQTGPFIHITAGFGDVGFSGYWTLEIFCIQPIRIYPGVEVCQIYYHSILGDYEKYKSRKIPE